MTCGPHHPDKAFRQMEAQRSRQQRNRAVWNAAWTGAVAGAVNGARGVPAVPAQVRIGDAERESAVTALGEHYAAGRLTKDEFDERASSAWSARTAGDLSPLFTDLPALQAPPAPRPQPVRGTWWLGVRLSWVLVLLVVLAMTDILPWFVVAIFAGLWWTGTFTAFHRRVQRGRSAPGRR